MKQLAIAFVLFAAACGGGGSKKPDTVTAQAGVELEFGELKIIDVNKNEAVLVHANGEIEMAGVKVVKVTKDGKIVRTDNGEVGFVLNADGTIKGPEGKVLELTLSSDAVIKNGDKTITLDAAGLLLGGNPDAPQMKVEGATTTGQKRTALFVLIALTTPMGKPVTDAKVEEVK